MKQSSKTFMIIAGVLYAILGIYLLMNPEVNLLGLSLYLSFIVLFGGISEISTYWKEPAGMRDGWILASGILSVVIGIYFLLGGFVALPIVIPYVIGFWMLVYGVLRVIRSFKVRQVLPTLSKGLLLTGGAGIIFGVLLMLHPLFTSTVIAYIISIVFIYEGIVLLVDAFR